jgi:LemA protein
MGIALLLGLGLLGVVVIAAYNALVRARNRVDQAFSSIEVQLTQRYDLITKLVEVVRQYMGHERSLLEDIVRLRQKAAASQSPESRIRADNELSHAMTQLNVQMENYPQLRSSDTFVQLQRSLNEVEEQVAAARRSYNAAVTEYNSAIQSFPGSLVAGAAGFGARGLFVAEERKLKDVDMKALFNA